MDMTPPAGNEVAGQSGGAIPSCCESLKPEVRPSTCRDELRQPLLSNGHYDEEVALPEPKVMPPPSSSADSDDEEEQAEHSWWEQVRHMWSSPLMATACCIFLCYILKVLQQVPASSPEPSTLAPPQGLQAPTPVRARMLCLPCLPWSLASCLVLDKRRAMQRMYPPS